jgi:integrase
MIGGKRRQFSAPTLEAAEAKAAEKMALFEQGGIRAMELKPAQLFEAAEVIEALATEYDGKVSLRDLLEFYRKRRPRERERASVHTVYTELLESQAARGLRAKSIRSTRSELAGLVAAYGATPIADIHASDIEAWLRTQDFGSPVSRNNKIRYLKGFFNFARRRRYVVDSPADDLDKAKVEEAMPEYMPADQVTKLMAKAEEIEPKIVARLALGFFAGIRTEELNGLLWSDIRWDQRIVTVSARVAKTRRTRHVTIAPNLLRWLMAHRQPGGQFGPKVKRFNERRQRVQEAAGVPVWPQNCMRHTFATMHFAMHQNAAQTAAEMGHRDQDLLYRHYRGLATNSEAERFWDVQPKGEGARGERESA